MMDGRAAGIRDPAGARLFSPHRSDQFFSQPILLSNGHRRFFPRGVKREGCEDDHSLPSSTEVNNAWIKSSWLQIRRPGLDSRHYQKKKIKVVGLERGPLSLVSTNEELLDRKVAAPV
jgi:hypothetical protein